MACLRDLERSGDWYERVLGFQRVLIEEDEDRVTMPAPVHFGWALDVIDSSGLRIQLHTYEAVSADDT
jgi:hypothetical protein